MRPQSSSPQHSIPECIPWDSLSKILAQQAEYVGAILQTQLIKNKQSCELRLPISVP